MYDVIVDRRFMPDDELAAFVRKVEKLKSEGVSVSDIARRCGIARTTLNQRLARWREKQRGVAQPG